MVDIKIVEVQSKKEEKAFFAFPMKLYRGCPNYVPPLIIDEIGTFSPEENPAFEVCDAGRWLAMRGSEVVGRIAAIVNHPYNELHGTRNARFGWFDCIEDYSVASALFDAAVDWARLQGMTVITGPQGFTGFDKEGMLVHGFDELPTMATYYNYPYYNDFVEKYGFGIEYKLVEYRILNISSKEFPPRLEALAEKIKERRNYRLLEFTNKRQILDRAGELLALLEETYSDLDGFAPLTDKQRLHCTEKFFPLLNHNLIKGVANRRDELIGFFVAIPSISQALQKAKGRLFPFGFWHLWRAMKGHTKTVDFAIAGVKKKYRGTGVDLIMGAEMYKSAAGFGFLTAESNPELETNMRVRSEWKHFDHLQHKRRRVYRKEIDPKQE